MEITIAFIIKLAAATVVGFFAGPAAVLVFNRMPAKWLTEWNEEPSQELSDPYVKRIKENPWRWAFAVGFICVAIRLVTSDLGDMTEIQGIQLAAVGLPVCWVLLIIALADRKYMIIPDQMVMVLAMLAIGRVPFYSGLSDPLIGAAIGGGFMLIVAGLGALISKKEVLGFGDVKLCLALGLVMGIRGTIATLVLGILASGLRAAVGLAHGNKAASDMIPLGPYLCGSAIVFVIICWPFGL